LGNNKKVREGEQKVNSGKVWENLKDVTEIIKKARAIDWLLSKK
jgi:hypothetical protein